MRKSAHSGVDPIKRRKDNRSHAAQQECLRRTAALLIRSLPSGAGHCNRRAGPRPASLASGRATPAMLAPRRNVLVRLRTAAVRGFLRRAEVGEFAREHKTPDDVTKRVL
jgi:hypothetical protein